MISAMNRKKDVQARVKRIFEDKSCSFDSVYSQESGIFMNFINRIFRWDIRERARMSFDRLSGDEIRTVLDIGCGTGRLALDLARCGKKVTGIDFSSSMIEAAQRLKEREGATGVEFLYADFLEYGFSGSFDASVALGFFDYAADPSLFFSKMNGITKNMLIATFHIKGSVRSLFRKARLFLLNRPVYFYSREEINNLMEQARFKIIDFRIVGNLYFVQAARVGG